MGCKRGAGQNRQVWGCMVVAENRTEGTSRLVLEGGRQAVGRGRKVLGRDRKVLETNKLVVGLYRQVLERNMLALELHKMALHFCWFRK